MYFRSKTVRTTNFSNQKTAGFVAQKSNKKQQQNNNITTVIFALKILKLQQFSTTNNAPKQ